MSDRPKTGFDFTRLYRGKLIFYWLTAVGLAADLGSKVWAERTLVPPNWKPGIPTPVHSVIDGVFAWKWAVNFGAAFSMFAGHPILLTTVSLAALSVLFIYLYREQPDQPGLFVGLGLVASGALGNVWDRVWFGSVRDFMYFDFDLPGHESIPFIPQRYPVFNVADIAIIAGAILLVVVTARKERQERRERLAAAPAGGAPVKGR